MRMYVYMFIYAGVSICICKTNTHTCHTFCNYGQFNTGCILKKVIAFFLFLIERDKYQNIMPQE